VADEKLEVEVRANINGLDRDMAAASKSIRGLGDASDIAAKKAESHARKMEDLKRASTEVGRGMLIAGTALAAGVALSVIEFAKYDKALSGYRAVSQATRAETDQLTKQAMKLGEAYGYTAVEVVNAATALNKAGVSTKDVLGGALSGALTLAATDTMDVAEAAEVAAIAMTQFKLQGKDVPHIADLLAAGAANAVGDVKDLSWGLRQSGLVASQFGLSIEETVGTLSAFASAGLIGSDAGTSFKQMLLSLASPSGVAAKKMAELGLSAYDANGDFIGITALAGELQDKLGGLSQEGRNAALSLIFGQDAIRSSAVLYEMGAEKLGAWIKKNDEAGFAARVAAEKLNNLNGDWKKLTVSINNALIDMGGNADSFLRPIVQSVTGAVQAFRDLPEPVKGGILAVAGLTAGALLLGGAVMTAVPKIVEFKESWDKLSAAGGKHASTMNRVVTALSGITAAYAAATIGARMLADAQNASDKKANSKEIINRITGAKGSTELSSALDDSFRGINDDVNTDRMTKVDDFGGALNRIYRPKMADSQQDFFSDAFMIKENGGGDKARKAFAELDKSLADLAGSGSAEKATATFAEMQKRADKIGISVGDLVKLVPNYKDTMIDLATQNGLTNLSEEDKIRVLSGSSSAMSRANMTAEQTAQVQQKAAEETQKYSEALAEIGVSILGTIDNLATFTEFMVQAGLLTLSARDASVKFEESIDDMGQKIKDIMATEQQLGGVLNETRTDFDRSSEAGRAANIVYGDLATKGIASAVAMAKAGEGQEVIQGELVKTYDNMVLAGKGFGLTEDAAIALTREVLKVPAGVDINSWMAETARREAEKTKAAMDAIDGRVVRTYAEHRETKFIETKRSDSVVNDSGGAFDPNSKAYASGGAVIGPGMKGVDSVRSMLAPGEHVLTADEVDKMGGQSAVYAMRAAIRSGAAYSAPAAPVAAVSTGAGTMPPIYIMSPFTGDYVLAQMDTRAAGAINRADQQSAYTRRGRQ
jgi:TP901 family phage tail tape measure protein